MNHIEFCLCGRCQRERLERTHRATPLGPIMPSETADGLALEPPKYRARKMDLHMDALDKIEDKPQSKHYMVHGSMRGMDGYNIAPKPNLLGHTWVLVQRSRNGETWRAISPGQSRTAWCLDGVKYWRSAGYIYQFKPRRDPLTQFGPKVEDAFRQEAARDAARATRTWSGGPGNWQNLPRDECIIDDPLGPTNPYWENQRYTAAPTFDKLQQGRNCS